MTWAAPAFAPDPAAHTDIKRRHGKANPAKAAIARKILIATWHVLALQQPFKPSATRATDLSRQAPAFVWPPDGPQTI
jgi:hypothetical protein